MSPLGVAGLISTLLLFHSVYGNLPGTQSNANNIFDALTKTLTCGQFKTLITGAGLPTQQMYTSQIRLTLFVPNDTAFQQIPFERLTEIINMPPSEKEDFVRFFTVGEELQTSGMNNNIIKKSLASDNNKLFFSERQRRLDDIGGNAGNTEYFVNGALIIRPNVRAGNGIVHVIDRVLNKSISTNAYGFIKRETSFFTKLVNYITGEGMDLSVFPLQNLDKLTLFVPTDEAINKIPPEKLEELRSTMPKLVKVLQQHIIQNKVVYTSFVNHNEGFNAIFGRNIFRKLQNDKVYISGGGVTAEIVQGNLTVENGAVHYIDNILGFVYNSAKDQIEKDETTKQFDGLTNKGRKELKDFLVRPSGVTVFVPTNEAFQRVQSLPGVDLYTNASLIDEVLRRSFLEPGDAFEITRVNGDYTSRTELLSQFRGKSIKIYSQGNATWAEGGYVKARVIRPDIGVTNGYVHYIDGIFGVPSRDIPGTIFCEDWLIKTSYVLSTVNLNDYLRDSRITTQSAPCPSTLARRELTYVQQPSISQVDVSSNNNNYVRQLFKSGCGQNNRYCEFTMFVPNGTAIEFFQMTEFGLRIMSDKNRLRYVLDRHLVFGKKVYLDNLGPGSHSLTTMTGDIVRLRKVSNKYSEVLFEGQRAEILHGDIGATNGVIHIINRVLHNEQDLFREINSSQQLVISFSLTSILLLIHIFWTNL